MARRNIRGSFYVCSIGRRLNQVVWSFESGFLPSNTYVTKDGHLLIYDFDRSNLGLYTCSAHTPRKHLSKSIDFQPENIFDSEEALLSFQVYSSRVDYRLGGRLLVECISSSRSSLRSCPIRLPSHSSPQIQTTRSDG